MAKAFECEQRTMRKMGFLCRFFGLRRKIKGRKIGLFIPSLADEHKEAKKTRVLWNH
tara:strand:- start:3896 stop:4066 length:171 start_codon:yes stop_codon:yes gene_type:complete